MNGPAIIVDWGTSSFRAWLVDLATGAKLDEIQDGKGLRDLTPPEFPDYCRAHVGRWRDKASDAPIYLAGMVGSPQGWRTAAQLDLPVRLGDLAAELVRAEGVENAWIVPGCRYLDAHGVADLMRGEEVQIFGALAIAKRLDADLCLPGTHSKWAQVRDGALVAFTTSMTGEVYGALMNHTLLGRPAEREPPFTEVAFQKGLAQAGRARGLLHHIFTARSRYIHGDLTAGDIASYLSGLLIGHELQENGPSADRDDVMLVCGQALKRPYELALGAHGVRHAWIAADEASIAGICEVIKLRRAA